MGTNSLKTWALRLVLQHYLACSTSKEPIHPPKPRSGTSPPGLRGGHV